jgi:hypothetical protein
MPAVGAGIHVGGETLGPCARGCQTIRTIYEPACGSGGLGIECETDRRTTAMKISNATIDCWLYVSGHGSQSATDPYSDFQHHHWEIASSATIDNKLMNKPSYTWTLNGRGYDDNGSWSAINQSKTSNAQVWISSGTTVTLKQTVGFGVNEVPATGSTNATNHQVPELIWPPLTWDTNANTQSPITHSDGSLPTYRIVTVPTGGKKSLRRLAIVPGVGGRDYTNSVQYFQKPAVVGAIAWWAWTIKLS